MERVDINDVVKDEDYENEEIKRRIEQERQKYFERNGRWPEEDGILIDVVI